MKVTGPKQTIRRARQLRQNMSKSERLLWWALRRQQTGYRFRRQHPAGPYVLDFYCDSIRLCVEVDGEDHDFRVKSDARRDAWLSQLGIATLRVPAQEVLSNLEGVVRLIIGGSPPPIGHSHAKAPSGASRHLPLRGRS
jgi:very-short-patch-repair endonuclease